jgi:hypothetical protein
MWWFSRRIPVEDLPEVAFALAYLNGLMLPLLMFGDYRNVGWWLALIACTGLVVQLVIIALRTRAARRLAAASKTSTLPESASPGS